MIFRSLSIPFSALLLRSFKLRIMNPLPLLQASAFQLLIFTLICTGYSDASKRNGISLRHLEQNAHAPSSGRSPRVNGGRIARPNEYPYMAAIYARVRNTPVFAFSCGGSIYNKNFTMTAGHCLQTAEGQKRKAEDVRVLVGLNKVRIFLHEDSVDLHRVSNTFIHPSYDTTSTLYFVTNDIAMVQLERPLHYTGSIKKLRVATLQDTSVGGLADVTGWGRTEVVFPFTKPGDSSTLPVSLDLKTARLRIIPNPVCTLRHFSIIPQTILCAGSEGLLETQSACYGDSGGPLTCPGPSGPYLCGIVSTGVGCGLRFTPTFYTKVSEYGEWIRRIGGTQ